MGGLLVFVRSVDWALLGVGLLFASGLRGDLRAGVGAGRMTGDAPRMILWAWEEPEDLRTADPRRLGVAFLAERVFVGQDVDVVPRRQRILTPDGMWAEAVVRIEAERDFVDNAATRKSTAEAVLDAARLSGIRGVQVDFDAGESQRAFYADVLPQVRAGLPQGVRLEMTALVSWCSQEDGWMRSLPVDAAVPMYFRLGEHVGWWGVREPLCDGSIGIATDEPAIPPESMSGGQRLYVFAPRPWTAGQLTELNEGMIPQDRRGAR
jgi:hypothetical protein